MQIESKVNVLMVDDHPENLLALEAILDRPDQNLVKAISGEEALRCLLYQDFAVILLDVQMPGIDGFETAELIRQRPRSQYTPIIFLTAFSNSDTLVSKGYSLGAVDYLFKPIDAEILTSKVSVFVDLFKKTEEVKRQAAQLKAVNTELVESEQRLQDFLDNANDLIQIISPSGQFLYVNQTWQKTLGYDQESINNLSCFNIVHPDSQNRYIEAIKSVQNQNVNRQVELIFITKEGTKIIVEGNLNCQFEDEKPIAIRCIFHDITGRKQAEQAHTEFIREQAARQQAEAANRMKDEFLATLSHELRTPLNSMLGWVRLLRTRKFDEATTARALETMERNARLQAKLIEDILDVSRIIQGKLRLNLCPVNLTPVIEAAIDAIRPTAEAKAIALQFMICNVGSETTGREQNLVKTGELSENSKSKIPNPKLFVLGDSSRLQQVVWNLLTNAIKFTSEGGTIAVRLERTDTHIQIQVRDTGIGINTEFLPYIFERFRQADSTTTRSHGGLGLGLAIVRHLVELHGGSIHADSEGEGKGATFTVKLLIPATLEESNGKQISPTTVEVEHELTLDTSLTLNGLRILVVDDESDGRDLLKVVFEECGAKVTAVASASEAIETLEQLQFDVLISDIGMPDEDGYTLIRKVRCLEANQGGQIPAIALTAYVSKEDYTQAIAAGFQIHLSKPVETTELITAVAKLARHPNKVCSI